MTGTASPCLLELKLTSTMYSLTVMINAWARSVNDLDKLHSHNVSTEKFKRTNHGNFLRHATPIEIFVLLNVSSVINPVGEWCFDSCLIPFTRLSISSTCLCTNVTNSITYSTNFPWTSAMYNTVSQSVDIHVNYWLVVNVIKWESEYLWMLLNVDSDWWIQF